MPRQLVLFAREPAREAREKGFASHDAADLFASFAAGWLAAARETGARLVVASPREDHPAWRRCFGAARDVLVIDQEGRSFGERLERVARRASALGGATVLVGGDVPPCRGGLERAFSSLEAGMDAVLAPAPDGGVSLIGFSQDDLDLLRTVAPRRRNVFSTLSDRLRRRGRTVVALDLLPDVDGRTGLATLSRFAGLAWELRVIVLRLLVARDVATAAFSAPRLRAPQFSLPILRGPPRAA